VKIEKGRVVVDVLPLGQRIKGKYWCKKAHYIRKEERKVVRLRELARDSCQ